VFAGGFTLEAVETVCRGTVARDGFTLDGVTSLVDLSLVQVDGSAEPGPRFGMLETIREYALERLLASGEADRIRRGHAAYFLALAEEAEPHLKGPEQETWLERLGRDDANLRAVLQWATESGEAEVGLRLAVALERYWVIRGYAGDGRRALNGLLALPRSGSTALLATALGEAGTLARIQGDLQAARRLHEEALIIRRDLAEPGAIASSVYDLATIAFDQSDYLRARRLLEEALATWRELGDMHSVGAALCVLGDAALARGDYSTAQVLLEESLAVRTQVGEGGALAYSLLSLGGLALAQGNAGTARTRLQEALSMMSEVGWQQGIARSLFELGRLSYFQGDESTARLHLEESLRIRRQIGYVQGIAEALHQLGRVATSVGDLPAARSLLVESLTIQQSLGNGKGVIESLEAFAAWFVANGQPERAVCLSTVAARHRERLGEDR
jgi:tetratricopeptide (TPR) repeat protein